MDENRNLSREEAAERRRRREQRARAEQRRRKRRIALMLRAGCAAVLLLLVLGIVFGVKSCSNSRKEREEQRKAAQAEALKKQEQELLESEQAVAEAEKLIVQYDYEGAITLLQSVENYEKNSVITGKIAAYKKAIKDMVSWNVNDVEHIYIGNIATTLEEGQTGMTPEMFQQTLQQMYDDGYLLVDIYDLAIEKTDDEGKKTYQKADLKVPAGKKPFVLSQDNVVYPSPVVTGVEAFLVDHPDFSYKGARGILGVTGVNGILGFTGPDLDTCKAAVKELKNLGWHLACNGYSGMTYASTLDRVQTDLQKWKDEVGSVIGDTDILLYPGGIDIGSWTDYDAEDEKFAYLKSMGFAYFCNIDDENDAWVQIRDSYVRQARKEPPAVEALEPIAEGTSTESEPAEGEAVE